MERDDFVALRQADTERTCQVEFAPFFVLHFTKLTSSARVKYGEFGPFCLCEGELGLNHFD